MLKFLKCGQRSLEDQLVLYGTGITFLFLVPFSIYRLMIGDLILATIDLVMALLMVVLFTQSWRSRKYKYLNIFAVFLFMLGIIGVMYLKGTDLIFWTFPGIGAAYFLLQSRPALVANIIFISSTILLFFDKLTQTQVLGIFPSLVLVCLFGFIFSMRSERQNKKLLKLVSEDTLTRIKNRRSYDEKVVEILANYKRFPKPSCMLLLDLDMFKKINDFHGHKQGDQVLIDFAKLIKSRIRETDFIYRFGGEEFVVIAKNSSLEDSGNLAESLRKYVQESEKLAKYKLTVSIGVSEIMPLDDADSWFRRADLALYESKSSGRNTVRIAEVDEDEAVRFKELCNYQNIKPLSAKANSLLRPYTDISHTSLVDNSFDGSNSSLSSSLV